MKFGAAIVSFVGVVILFFMVVGAIIVLLPFLTKWVWSVVIPGCFPGVVAKGYLAARISWKVAFCMSLLPGGGVALGITKWLSP